MRRYRRPIFIGHLVIRNQEWGGVGWGGVRWGGVGRGRAGGAGWGGAERDGGAPPQPSPIVGGGAAPQSCILCTYMYIICTVSGSMCRAYMHGTLIHYCYHITI